MVVRKVTGIKMGFFLLCVVSSVLMVVAQELEHFDKDSTVDFEKLGVLAEILATHSTTRSRSVMSTTSSDDVYTSRTTTALHLKSTSRSTQKTTTSKEALPAFMSTRLAETSEDAGRIGRVVGREVTSEPTAELEETETAELTTDKGKQSEKENVTTYLGQTLNAESADFMPPHITWPRSQERIIVKTNDAGNYRIRCTADGEPKPTFEWRKDDIRVENSPGLIQAFQNGTLYIQQFSSRENGLYQCRATNRYGTSVSVKVPILRDEDPRSIPGLEKRKTVNGKIGEAGALTCADTPPTVSRHTRRWYFYAGSREVKTDQRVGTDSEGTLRFAHLKQEDQAIYTCGLAPEVAESQPIIKFYNEVDLQISPGTPVHSPPKLEFASKSSKAVLGTQHRLECFFSGYPTPTMTWMNNINQVIRSDDSRYEVEDEGRKLRIKKVEQRDEGNFTCMANNGAGQPQQYLSLNVTSPPLRVEQNVTLTSPDGRDVTLKCKAEVVKGESMDTPIWYRNGELLTKANLPDPSRYTFSSDFTELYITDLRKQHDTACFQCNITNSEGYLFYDGYLRVIESIEIIRKPLESIEISHNEVIDISVVATGDGCCPRSKHWERDGKILSPEVLQKPPFVWSNDGETILFNASSVSNATLKDYLGHYMCRVSNNFDAAQVTFTISLIADTTPGPQTAGDSNIKLWWVGLICGLLAIIIAIVVIIFFIKSNYPRDTYQLEKTELKHHLNPEEDLLNQSFQDI